MNKYESVDYADILASVNKPSRYINHEINAYLNKPTSDKINFCFAFPDVYEIGISHLGLKILYTIINNANDATADRVYAPWPDFSEVLQKSGRPLFSVEHKLPLKNFDVIGFTLQSELTFTNVLFILDLSGISLLSTERTSEDPIIISGGPAISNPEPMADFFDAILIGDGEEAILEIKDAMQKTKNKTRFEKLSALSEIEGLFVPQIHSSKESNTEAKRINIRKFSDFDNMEYTHLNQLIPWQQATHNRYVAEIMRGCSRGCRFCHAGMFYRPVRERSPEKMLPQIIEEVKKYGWEEVALSSLSSSDYTCIKPLIFSLYNSLKQSEVNLSLPSLRVDSLDEDLIKMMNSLNQRNLTIAPEAGSQRLRDIINKNLSEEEILKGIEIAVENGWNVVKLYFMIGLPFEEQQDIEAILDLINKIIQISRKKLQINITLSPFVPKPFTPFQWAAMLDAETILERVRYIKQSLKRYRFIKVSYHEIESSLLEAIISRGDHQVGELILKAYKNGARFDGWNEYFNFEVWKKSAEQINLDLSTYTAELSVNSHLPWDYVNLRISKQFLLSEWEKAKSASTTPDCRISECTNCGVCNSELKNVFASTTLTADISESSAKETADYFPGFFYRVFYSKMGNMQFVSYLDLMRMIYRIVRASELPIIYSQGFNPHPRITFGPPLSIGIQGEKEYFDVEISKYYTSEKIESIFSKILPCHIPM
ncbi:MAG: TIGR03960 family B12-binding radical SAM protein, partial [Candidatus Cloacimonetes bacterium]|nr:TIGR03960 family B12-binding radical SAM protein [Candidatus Cloacimonadota bacterium]